MQLPAEISALGKRFALANFLGNRAVKPFLLPVMVFYFGWVFTLVFTAFTVLGALLNAFIVERFSRTKEDPGAA